MSAAKTKFAGAQTAMQSKLGGIMQVKSKQGYEGGQPEAMQPLKDLQSDDPNRIYCVGDNACLLKFEIGHMNWMRLPVDNDEKS